MSVLRSFAWRSIAIHVALAFGAGTAFADGLLPIREGIAVPYGAGWSPAPPMYRNALELVRGEPGDSPGAFRVLVSWEERTDRGEALRRLQQIGAESTTTVYTEVCGWPGLRQRYTRRRTLPGQDLEVQRGERVLQVVTAVAVDRTIVRLLGTMPARGDQRGVAAIAAMGADLRCERAADAAATRRALETLRSTPRRAPPATPPDEEEATPPPAGAATAAPGANAGAPQLLQNGFGEIEIAASPDGQHIIMAANSGYSTSNDGGVSFSPNGSGLPAPGAGYTLNGDPSVAYGVSGTFYYAVIGFPMGRGGPQCSTAIYSSTDNAQTFNYVADAFRCDDNNGPICFPDQEHIAADALNAAPGGGDQVYSTWRNFSGGCNNAMTETPSIVCSQDGGQNWSAATVINGGNGIYPRITVGSDGFVYVIYEDSGNIMLDKYSSCANGLALQAMFPATVTAVTPITCPVPGLDRCNSGNRLTSHMVAVDDTNPMHVYAAYATETNALVDADVMVVDSPDGGVNWGTPVRVNTNTNGVRFMPWVCSESGVARVGWYDRRAGADLTDYYCGSAAPNGGGLAAGAETNLTNNPDPQCNSGWPCPPRATGDAESCPNQPQLAGRCCTGGLVSGSCPMGMGSNQQCDYSSTVCPMGESCQLGRGCPKYGDYNGNACVAGRVLNAWASATPPAGLLAPGGIAVFFDSKLAGAAPDLTISKVDVPDPVIAGTALVYTVTVTNNGPASAMNVVWTDDPPGPTALIGFAGITFVPGWSCMTPPINSSGTITCSKPFMAIGESQDFDITLLVRSNVPNLTMLSNEVEIGSDDPGTDSQTISTLVITRADLEIMKIDMPDPALIGGILTFTITVKNLGPSDAQNAVMNEQVPAHTTFHSIDAPPGWACVTPPMFGIGMISCTTPTFAFDDEAVFTVHVLVDAGAMQSIDIFNSVEIGSDTIDPDPGNNPAMTETGTISAAPLLEPHALLLALALLAGIAAARLRRTGLRDQH